MNGSYARLPHVISPRSRTIHSPGEGCPFTCGSSRSPPDADPAVALRCARPVTVGQLLADWLADRPSSPFTGEEAARAVLERLSALPKSGFHRSGTVPQPEQGSLAGAGRDDRARISRPAVGDVRALGDPHGPAFSARDGHLGLSAQRLSGNVGRAHRAFSDSLSVVRRLGRFVPPIVRQRRSGKFKRNGITNKQPPRPKQA